MRLALITARGGSKRIPRKNIREFLGRPIISYSIEAAREAGCFDEVMVSTDDPEIAEAARSLGASVPFMRSAAASGDHATTAEAIEDVLSSYERLSKRFESVCCIYPTAPFISGKKLAEGFRNLSERGCDAVVPVVRFSYPIQRALKIEGGRLAMIQPENMLKRSQDLMPTYHDAGQFYWLKVSSFMQQKTLFMANTSAVEIAEEEVQDIDTESDWIIAELKYRLLRERSRVGH